MNEIVIVDSECANLNSICKAVKAAGLSAVITDKPDIITGAKAVIFPGVGSYKHAMQVLEQKKLVSPLLASINKGTPFLGICLGMQLLFTCSEETHVQDSTNKIQGLNAIKGLVGRFSGDLPVPHVGWNKVRPVAGHPLFYGLGNNSYFYFTHSYYVIPENNENILAETSYGINFTSAVIRNNLLGVQFHPEKSGPAGLRLLSNFGKIIAGKEQ
jgi:imidazole glycerol phosphate synthase glutamine amidotransferase subunit